MMSRCLGDQEDVAIATTEPRRRGQLLETRFSISIPFTPVRSCRHRRHLRLCAAAMRALPSTVRGPVLLPPWYLHLPLVKAPHRQEVLRLVWAPQNVFRRMLIPHDAPPPACTCAGARAASKC
jgi:hypothetical protein